MSTDPNSGIALITMFDSADGQLSNGEQFTGVLIAPDEILTVAHGVNDPSGNVRNTGTAYLGHDGGALTGGVSISSGHVLDGSHTSGGADDDAQVATDFAVVHLSQPVTGAATFALGEASPGTYTVTGYPAVNDGGRTSTSEALTSGNVGGELFGTSLVPAGTSEGASGSPVYTTMSGTPTVVGLDVAENRQGGAEFMGLTASDIAQIDAWVYADDKNDAWGSQFAPQPTGGTGTGGSGSSTGNPSPTKEDRLDVLAGLVEGAAASSGGFRATMLSDVSSAITVARQQGASGTDLPDSADLIANVLDETSSLPKRAVAFMVGMLVDESGVARSRIAGYAANVFGIQLGKAGVQVALQGYEMDRSFGAQTTGAPIAAPSSDGWSASGLAAALNAQPAAQMMDTSSPALVLTGTTVPAFVASHVQHGTSGT